MDREAIITSLRAYKNNPDDDNIRYKEKIKKELLSCDELIYALNNKKLEDAGADNDEYFGINIRPYLMIPETQSEILNYLCFKSDFENVSTNNKIMKYALITFTIMCRDVNNIDADTGIPRHDLIAAIIRDHFNWSNIFGTQCTLITNKESTTDSNYATRTLVFKFVVPNSIVRTDETATSIVNTRFRR